MLPKFCLAIFLPLLACKAVPPAQHRSAEVAIERLGKEIDAFPSPAGQYILYIQRVANTPTKQAVRFVVVEESTATIVEQQSFLPGYVKWSGDDTLELLDMPGMIREGEDLSGYVRTIHIRSSK